MYARLSERLFRVSECNCHACLRIGRDLLLRLRLKLREHVGSPNYIFAESRVGYRMARAETQETEP